MTTSKLGGKVRALRRKEGLTQTDLATRLEISPSYLNLIEHNQRPLPAHLLLRVAQTFSVDLASFADDSQARLAGDLQEIFGDPLFEEHPLTTNDLRELAENGAASRAIIALYHAYRAQTDSARALAAIAVALILGVLIGVTTGIADRIISSETPASTPL